MIRPHALRAVAALALAAFPLSAFPLRAQQAAAVASTAPIIAIKAGRLIDPATGTVALNQIILVQNRHFLAVGPSVAIPKDAQVIDLSLLTVLPGLVDAHNHLALTYKDVPERNSYYITTILDDTPLRAIQAVSNGIQMLSSGFTIVRDMGNNGKYADIALRRGIEQGLVPGPTIIPSGLIISGMGGQFSPNPEMAFDRKIVYPEYLEADTPDEIVKAVRQNALVGARVIKICVDCKLWGYSTDEIKLVIREAAKAGLKVEGHVQSVAGAHRAVDAGIWSIAHDNGMNDTIHKIMAEKRIFRAGTETPLSLVGHTTEARYAQTVLMLRNAWENKVPITFSTDADYYVPGKTRGEVAIEFVETWKAARIPAPDILRAMTTTGYEVSETTTTRGPIKPGMWADLIAVPGNPLQSIDALRNVKFVLKNGMVFKKDGVMTPEAFFNGGPVNGVNAR
ncbi:amidohydrolase family protein [Gemmatimonas sp.]|uniref:amidohydrolase family protein n=1 Tax=Gemmatimonas sp. TaxID=1962908 RepID=UPI00286E2A06|nr:amidohydrolase family protein [Gemmatimonas sp.]